MSLLDRLLLILLSVAGLIAGVFALLSGFSAVPANLAGDLAVYPGDIAAMVIGVVVVLVSLRFLLYKWGKSDVDYVVLPGEYGSIRISFETIEQLSDRTGKVVRGVQEFETRVRGGDAGVLLSVRVRALPDLDLAKMSVEIQESIKSYVESTAGITVERITVNIVEVANSPGRNQRAWMES